MGQGDHSRPFFPRNMAGIKRKTWTKTMAWLAYILRLKVIHGYPLFSGTGEPLLISSNTV